MPMNGVVARPKSRWGTTYSQNRDIVAVRTLARDHQKDRRVKSVDWCSAAFGSNLGCDVDTECFDVVRENIFCGSARSIEVVGRSMGTVVSQPHIVVSSLNEIVIVHHFVWWKSCLCYTMPIILEFEVVSGSCYVWSYGISCPHLCLPKKLFEKHLDR